MISTTKNKILSRNTSLKFCFHLFFMMWSELSCSQYLVHVVVLSKQWENYKKFLEMPHLSSHLHSWKWPIDTSGNVPQIWYKIYFHKWVRLLLVTLCFHTLVDSCFRECLINFKITSYLFVMDNVLLVARKKALIFLNLTPDTFY